MPKRLSLALFGLLASSLFGQWTQAPSTGQAQYPQGQSSQSEYPQNQYSQTQYPDAAQAPATQSQAEADAPDPADLQHGVARVSIVQGDVNIRRGDNGQLSGAVVNAPVLARDHVETSQGSRAEVQLDAGTILRLAPNTDLGFADLQYHRAQVQLGLGSIVFRVTQNALTQVEIDTPSIGVRALTQGEYRISVFDNGTSQITVRNGEIELSGPRGSERINAGQSVMIRGDAADPEMQTSLEIGRDQFDEWSEDRDRAFSAPQSAQYVNADVQGAADLDQYGNWVPSGYGQVWRPQGVAGDWSPYSNGQWSYVDYYGWSWIDYSPWGWAPYHYGRWFWNSGYGWCWWPGARGYHAYWSPALVGFFGFGGRVGIGFGGLGWVALAPFESCHRWWGRGGYGGGFYNNRVGLSVGLYRNGGVRGGAMTARYDGFGGPHQRFTPASRTELASASSFSGRLPVNATQSSYNYSARQPVGNSRFSALPARGFFQQRTLGNGGNSRFSSGASQAGNSRPYAERYPAAAGSRSYPAAGSSVNRSYPQSSGGWRSMGGAAQSTPRASSPASSGWQRFGTPGGNTGNNYRQSYQSPESSGWHNFGKPQQSYSTPSYQQPRYSYQAPRPSYSAPGYNSAPSYSTPRYSAPRQSQPQSQPHYSAPSAPRGGGGGSSSHGGGGGGGHHGR